MTFALDPKLQSDTAEITTLKLCRVLLMKDRNYPWLLLVPQRANIREIYELAPADRALLCEEIAHVSKVMAELYKAHKINVAALGNSVPQLHVHVIVRYPNDPAWPKPVWGVKPAQHYPVADLAKARARIRAALVVGAGAAPAA
jgi:diadenosine tetraphosphate (Ap4A) HIT family hydrolase